MKIKVIKQHDDYKLGEHDVEDGRGNYLVRVGIAEEVKKKDDEKIEHKDKKEKVENVKHTPKHEK